MSVDGGGESEEVLSVDGGDESEGVLSVDGGDESEGVSVAVDRGGSGGAKVAPLADASDDADFDRFDTIRGLGERAITEFEQEGWLSTG